MDNSNTSEWNYVCNQEDIDFLLLKTYGLHDSLFKELNYIHGGYFLDKDKHIHGGPGIRRATLLLDSPSCNSVELVFEGVIALNLRPSGATIYGVSIIIRDECLLLSDNMVYDFDNIPDHDTWIKARSLRWRFIE